MPRSRIWDFNHERSFLFFTLSPSCDSPTTTGQITPSFASQIRASTDFFSSVTFNTDPTGSAAINRARRSTVSASLLPRVMALLPAGAQRAHEPRGTMRIRFNWPTDRHRRKQGLPVGSPRLRRSREATGAGRQSTLDNNFNHFFRGCPITASPAPNRAYCRSTSTFAAMFFNRNSLTMHERSSQVTLFGFSSSQRVRIRQ